MFSETVVFCLFRNQRKEDKYAFMIYLLSLLAKLLIHKCQFSNRKLNFLFSLNNVEQYIKLIAKSANKKAIKTLNICIPMNIISAM